ncbi:MAG: hypothetical protein LBC30_02205, partial [Puniceicoccales bacterium]|nr:hypothetical protein [Puniceicoccales bacterium]
LGLGRSGCEFVGREAWARAQRQPNSHIAVSVQSDFVASPDSPLPDVTRTPGRIVLIPNDNPKSIGEMHRIHFYREIFDKAYRDHITSHPRANGRLVA